MEDPRPNSSENILYPLHELIFLVIAAVVSGINDWKGVEIFGNNKLQWLRKFFDYKHGIPWQGTLGRIFAELDNAEFEYAFTEWVAQLANLTQGEVVAIDGKRMRGSYDHADNKAAIHMVSAYASQQGLCLGQLATDKKSNEITAIPKLLKLLTLEGCTVTIDAMGCQRKISQEILDQKADYILGVKENQKGLLEQMEKVFTITAPDSEDIIRNAEHGRLEQRRCEVIEDLTFFDDYKDWPGITSLIRIQAERINKRSGKTEQHLRYYISSKKADAKQFNQDVRSHWSIENKMHWVLDVTFGEDANRMRKGNSPENFSLFTKMAMALIDRNQDKLSRPKKRLHAALNDDFRQKLLQC